MKYAELFKEGMTVEEFNQAIEKTVQSESDRVRTEYTKQIKELEGKLPVEKSQTEIELEERIKKVEKKEREFKLIEKLEEKKLPKGLSKFIAVGDDELESIGDELGKILSGIITDNSFKPTGHKKTENVTTKEQFKQMGYTQREKFATDNPELFEQYTK
ncbi:MAG: hypothetical protein SCL54_14980 [Bacillota bacterium]|nr:hypothetical protein [Bacillota bacterium]